MLTWACAAAGAWVLWAWGYLNNGGPGQTASTREIAQNCVHLWATMFTQTIDQLQAVTT